MKKWLIRHFSALALAMCFIASAQAAEVPQLRGRVNDYAELLTPEQETALDVSLERIEHYEGQPQVVILTVRTTDGEEMAKYATAVGNAWEIGQADADNGIVLIVSYENDQPVAWIATGYGSEGVIPDITANRIVRQRMRPHFVDGASDYAGALTDAVAAIDTLIRGEQTGDPEIDGAAAEGLRNNTQMTILAIGGIIAAILGFFHWSLSGVVGSITGIVLVFAMGWTLWWMILLALPAGFIGGIIAHGFARVRTGIGVGGSGGGGSGYSGGGGSFGGGGGGGGLR